MPLTTRWGGLLFVSLAAIGCAAGGQFASPAAEAPVAAAERRQPPAERMRPPAERVRPPAAPAPSSPARKIAQETPPPRAGDSPPEETAASEENPDSSPHDITLPLPVHLDEDDATLPLPPGTAASGFAYDVPIVRNAIVDRWIEYFTGPGRERFAVWLRRSGRFMELFREILKKKGLPQDLAYVALIESGFNLRARSRAGAVGPWQFMRATGRRVGLRIDRYVDERRDPEKATRAAAAYLTRLYEEFGDWHLSLAAYNAGERRVQRAIQRTGRKTYWGLAQTRYLPQETRNYVGKFLAGLIIAKHPEVFGFAGIDYLRPIPTEAVALPWGMSLKTLSRLSGVPAARLAELNPHLRRRLTPPGKGHLIRVPEGKADLFRQRLARAPKESYPAAGRYRIRPGDTFGAIAARFGVRLQDLLELNAHLDPRRLRVGTPIILPRGKKRSRTLASTSRPSRNGRKNGSSPSHHTVSAGESIWTIARRYGVPADEIIRLNRLSAASRIFPGDRLRIRR